MRMKLRKSIGFKMAVAMAAGLFVVISLFSHTNVRLSERRLLAMAEREACKMSSAIKSSLDDAMLTNELDKVQAIVDAVAQEAMVEDIKVIALDGEVRMAKLRPEIGTVLDRQEKSCTFCHADGAVKRDNLTVLFEKADGRRILRNVNPIVNDRRCHGCHSPDTAVLGKLLVDFSTRDIDRMVTDNRWLLILSAGATLLASIGISILVALVLVNRPLHRLLRKMKEVETQEQGEDLVVTGEDEVTLLGETYDSMMAAIESRNRTIQEQMEEHLALFNVSAILNRSGSIDDSIHLILQALSLGFKVERSAVLLFDETGLLRVKGQYGMSADELDLAATSLLLPPLADQIMAGEPVVADSPGPGLPRFLVVPLKTAGRILGVITVHRVTGGAIEDEALRRSFAIVSTTMAPHFSVGLSQEEKKMMKVSPFGAFQESVDAEIHKVQEYMGSLSLALVRVSDYPERCARDGVLAASAAVQELGRQLSAALAVVHESTRISADTIAVVLPMLDRLEASDALGPALATVSTGMALTTVIASSPQDGATALELLHAAH
ncbi:MAG: hypothetical protein AB1634_18550 [Thermodesulfobacteriota bacterium]